MNKYIIPVCDFNKSKIYNLIIMATSYADCQDKIIEKFADYSESDDYDEFLNDLNTQDILIGKISDIEEL